MSSLGNSCINAARFGVSVDFCLQAVCWVLFGGSFSIAGGWQYQAWWAARDRCDDMDATTAPSAILPYLQFITLIIQT